VADALEHATTYRFYHTKFHRSRSNCLGAGRRFQKWGCWALPL